MSVWLSEIGRVAVTALLAVSILVALPQPASAAIITVNETDDELDIPTGDGDCSLREAIRAANLDVPVDACPAGSGADIVSVPFGTYPLEIAGVGEDNGQTGDLDITAALTIQASSGMPTIDGKNLDRVLDIPLDDIDVTISGFRITDGNVAGDGGGIRSLGDLTLANTSVESSQATGKGGGIATLSLGSATNAPVLQDSGVTFNTAVQGGGGIFMYRSSGQLERMRVGSNTTDGHGGGLLVDSCSVVVSQSWVHNNQADGNGGGLAPVFCSFLVDRTTISDNNAVDGDGLWNEDASNTLLANTTISGNGAAITGGKGGGVANPFNGSLQLHNVTFEANAASAAGTGGHIFNDPFADELTASNVLMGDDAGGGHCAGTSPTENGSNMEQDGDANPCGFDEVADVLIDTLEANGGPELLGGVGQPPTHALLPGSPAIDAATDGEAVDQRGLPRPQGSSFDLGSYERAFCQGVLVNEVGSEGDDSITASTEVDGILGLGGDDVIHALEGNDAVCAGAGNDVVLGGFPGSVADGADVLVGGTGADDLRGGGNADDLIGGGGGDLLMGQAGADDATGGAGGDDVRGNAGNDDLAGNGGPDKLAGGPGNDDCNGGPGTDTSTGCETKTGIP